MNCTACLFALTAIVAGCSAGSPVALEDRVLQDTPLEGFIVRRESRTVSSPSSSGGTVATQTLLLSRTPGSDVPELDVPYHPDMVRRPSGEIVPEDSLVVGRRVRVWTHAPVLLSLPGKVTADSIIVLD